VSLDDSGSAATPSLRISAGELAWVAAVVTALLLAAAFAWLAPALAKLYPAPSHAVFSAWAPKVKPEPIEDVRGMLALAAPFLAAGAVLLLGARRPARRSFDLPIIGAQIVGVGLLVWAILRQPHVIPLLPADYLDPLLLSVPNLVAGVCIGVVLTGVTVWWSGRPPRALEWLAGLAGRRWVAPATAVVATAVFLLPAVITDATVGQGGVLTPSGVALHAEGYMAVIDGRTPLVNYIGEYANLLPLAIAPLLSALGSSITAFTILMCTLSGIALLAIYSVFVSVTRRPWAALALYVPFLALSLFPWHDTGPFREFAGNYYAILPDRLFGPFVLALLCALSIRGRRIPAWSLFLVAGLSVINNSEFGVGALIATVLALVLGSERSVPLSRRLVDLGRGAAVGLSAAVAIVCAVTLVRTGSLPNPSLLSYYGRLVLRESFGLIPMPSLGLHWAVYATYAGALLMAAVRYARDDADRTLTGLLAFSGAFGLATGMYFVGRSIEFQLMILFPIWALSLALVAWAAAGALRSARADRRRLSVLLLPAAVALIGFGVMVSAIDRVSPPWRQVDRLVDGGRAIDDTPNAQRFIESRTGPGDHVLVIGTPLDHRLADRAGVRNVSPFNGFIALVSPAEADRSLNQLEDEGGNEVFEAVTAPSAINPYWSKLTGFATILRQRGYRLVERDPSSGLRFWRRAASAAGS
jgi:hypothetical protein